MSEAKTLGELKKSSINLDRTRHGIRKNLISGLEDGERILPGIIGLRRNCHPEIENAILSATHMVFLGERGRAKSRIIRGLTSLLDERIPIVEGCEISDNPFTPICRASGKRAPS